MKSLKDLLIKLNPFNRFYEIPKGYVSIVFQDNKIFREEHEKNASELLKVNALGAINQEYFMPKYEIKKPTKKAFRRFGTDYELVPVSRESFKGEVKIIEINGELKKGRVNACYQITNPLKYVLQVQSEEELQNHIEGIGINLINGNTESKELQNQIGVSVYNAYIEYTDVNSHEERFSVSDVPERTEPAEQSKPL